MIQRERGQLPFIETVYKSNKENAACSDLQAAFSYTIHP